MCWIQYQSANCLLNQNLEFYFKLFPTPKSIFFFLIDSEVVILVSRKINISTSVSLSACFLILNNFFHRNRIKPRSYIKNISVNQGRVYVSCTCQRDCQSEDCTEDSLTYRSIVDGKTGTNSR